MLVLSRKVGERILMPDYNIVLTVASVRNGRVRLAVSAPANVAVYREEVWGQIDENRQRLPAKG